MKYAVLLVLALAAPVSMAAGRDGLVTGPDVVAMLDDLGYSATLTRDGAGDPLVRMQTQNLVAYIHFYDCNEGACEAIQFRLGVDLPLGTTMDVVNDFNSSYRYARVYLDDEDDPFLVMDVEMAHADHRRQFETHLGVWEGLLARFTEAVSM